jgi:uncharacterized protein (TIGR02569 family)
MNVLLKEVIAAFGCSGQPKKLEGGEGKSWIVENLVLKPIDNAARYEWASELLLRIEKIGFRVSLPRRSVHGRFAHQGWGATTFEPGEHINGRWDEKLRVCRTFNQALAEVPASPMPQSDDRWSKSHEIVWGEAELPENIPVEISMKLKRIFNRYHKIEITDQVIHSDLCGNILFDADLLPLVIDFSPAYRPKEYGEAILVADAITWENAPIGLKDELPDTEFSRQMLLRAVNFRLIVAALFYFDDAKAFDWQYKSFQPLLEKLL